MPQPSVHASGREALALARRWLALERPDRALEEIDRLPDRVRSSAGGLLARATALDDLGRHGEAADAAARGLVEGGPDPSLLAVLGSARRALGQVEQAEQAYLDGLAIAPADARLLCAYAQLCLAVDQVDKAARLVERAAEGDPQADAIAQSRLLLAYVRGDGTAASGSGEASDGGSAERPRVPAAGGRDLRGGYQALRRAVAEGRGGAGPGDAELGFVAHPLMRPLRPVIRVGPLKVFLGVAAAVLLTIVLRWYAVTAALLVGWLALCAYALLAPPIARLLARRCG